MSAKFPLALVHGAGFEQVDGLYLPSADTAANADMAARLLLTGKVEVVICSGKGPLSDEEYPTTEALLMADRLMEAGVSGKRIIVEDRSTSTLGNHVLSAPYIQARGIENPIGIATARHRARCNMFGRFVASKAGGYNFDNGYIKTHPELPLGDKIKGLAIESVNLAIAKLFIETHGKTKFGNLLREYEDFKEFMGINKAKESIV